MKRTLWCRILRALALCGMASLAWTGNPGAQAAPPGRPLHSFEGPDGHTPATPLLLASDGNWYGTTSLGGLHHQGTVYRISPDGSFSVLHDFEVQGGGKDAQQVSALSEGPDHNFYGSIGSGNMRHGGFLFRVTPAGEYATLHQFGGFQTQDGRQPAGPPVPGPDGNFYVAMRLGGAHGLGAVYRMSPGGEVTPIHAFDGTDGTTPDSTLVVSPAGQIFGTTAWGPAGGVGQVYRMGLSGEDYAVVHAWPVNRKEGVFPTGLARSPNGDLYGVAVGLVSGPNGNFQGLVFKVAANGDFSIVYGFRDGAKAGIQPNAALALDAEGNLFGATSEGGAGGGGTAFRIEPDGHLSVLAELGSSDHAPRMPTGGAAPAADGSVWLATQLGGRHHAGQRGAIVRVPVH